MSNDNSYNSHELIRVLVADDDPVQRSLIKQRLVALNGLAVDAEDGRQAWDLLTSQKFDLAIVDLGMPHIDGIALIQCMRSHPRTRHLPIIVVTSHDDRASIEAAFSAGASSFLVKPVVWSTFEHHVGYLLHLVKTARGSRTASHQAMAEYRAKETILANFCGEAFSTVEALLAEIEHLKWMAATGQPKETQVHRLDRMADDCRALQGFAREGTSAIDALSDGIGAGDRKTYLDIIVDRVIQNVEQQAAATEVQLSVALPPHATAVSCDADAIEVALRHLVRNAITYSPRGGRVSVAANVFPDGLLAIEVTDHGKGIHPEYIARCFAPFQMTDDGGASRVRIGVGLLLSKAIAEAHNGTLELRSMPDQGTTAMLTLPPDRVNAEAIVAA